MTNKQIAEETLVKRNHLKYQAFSWSEVVSCIEQALDEKDRNSFHKELAIVEQERDELKRKNEKLQKEADIPASRLLIEAANAQRQLQQENEEMASKIVQLQRENEEFRKEDSLMRASRLLTEAADTQCKLQAERDSLRQQVEELRKWKEEDPRMLREQIRVADVAYQHLFEKQKATEQERDSLRQQVSSLKQFEALYNRVCVHHTDKEREDMRCPICLQKRMDAALKPFAEVAAALRER